MLFTRKFDHTNQRFGRLTARSHEGNGAWRCECDCGNTTIVEGHHLRAGNTKSCGCHRYVTHLACQAKLAAVKRHPVADTIFQERLARNLSRTQLSKISGYDKTRLRAIEEGRHMPTIVEAEDLLASMGMTFTYTIEAKQ